MCKHICIYKNIYNFKQFSATWIEQAQSSHAGNTTAVDLKNVFQQLAATWRWCALCQLILLLFNHLQKNITRVINSWPSLTISSAYTYVKSVPTTHTCAIMQIKQLTIQLPPHFKKVKTFSTHFTLCYTRDGKINTIHALQYIITAAHTTVRNSLN